MHRKGKSRCVTCNNIKFSQKKFRSNVTHKTYNVIFANESVLDCGSENIIYLITCTRCGIQYVGETVNALRFRMNAHRQSIKDNKDTLVAMHFNSTCSLEHFSVQPIEIISGNGRNEKSTKQRKLREAFGLRNYVQFILMDLMIIVMGRTGPIKMAILLHPLSLIKHVYLGRNVVIRRSIIIAKIGNMKIFFGKL